jgi:hypothetical protein
MMRRAAPVVRVRRDADLEVGSDSKDDIGFQG